MALPTRALASPNVSLDDPVYDELALLDTLGVLPPYLGGLAPLSEDRVAELLDRAELAPGRALPAEGTLWLRPIDRASLLVAASNEADRPYSVPARTRPIAGEVALGCEYAEGRPCGHGGGAVSALDASAGYGTVVSASARVLATTGNDAYRNAVALDRIYVAGHYGPVAAELGRDVLVLGPAAAHSEVEWSANAPAVDQLRLSGTHPVRITDELRGNLVYVLARLDDPQRYPNTLASIARGQLDIAGRVELGMHQELELGGDGAPRIGSIFDFIAEHFRRRDLSASATDSSNRRVGWDVTVHLRGARLYYEIDFEDWRKHFVDAVHYDADHLVGAELARSRDVAFTVEAMHTGVRSYEHTNWTTGFTTGGHTIGTPLGPNAYSLYAAARVRARGTTLVQPWLEFVHFSSDTYTFITYGPIQHAASGPGEDRYRAGLRVVAPLSRALRVDARVYLERVSQLAFVPGDDRTDLGMMLGVLWQPDGYWTR